MTRAFDFNAKTLAGKEQSLDQYDGRVLLVVNTASACGYTPQYAGLQALYDQYKDRGLVVLGFPCNQFGEQEPGSATEIGAFCQKNYGVEFPMFDKVEVNGDDAHPLFKWLSAQAPGLLGSTAIKWNFTKFLVDRKGAAIERFGSQTKPQDIGPAIERLL